jgi:ubiquinone/menaquinone biosynthesis C-methylase UbiE
MGQPIINIRDQQRASWDKFSTGWRKWDQLTMDFYKPIGDEILKLIAPKEGDIILDIASGTGEPGLTIASTQKQCKVVMTDISEGMLAVAREHAEQRGIKNISTRVCDACEMPFPKDAFDAISCRFGFMFFPDIKQAAGEMVRMLKPGGKLAVAVWNVPEKNFWATAMMDTINRNIQLPPPTPTDPGLFRCAPEGLIANSLRNAGLRDVSVREVKGMLLCGTAEVYWDLMTETDASIAAVLRLADDVLQDKIRQQVLDLMKHRYPNGNVQIAASALVIAGEK